MNNTQQPKDEFAKLFDSFEREAPVMDFAEAKARFESHGLIYHTLRSYRRLIMTSIGTIGALLTGYLIFSASPKTGDVRQSPAIQSISRQVSPITPKETGTPRETPIPQKDLHSTTSSVPSAIGGEGELEANHMLSLPNASALDMWRSCSYIEPESETRRKLLDIQLGGASVLEWYRSHIPDHDPTTAEAVSRWDHSVRVVNESRFERKIVQGIGWCVTRRGEDSRADGMMVRLSSDADEGQVRLKLADIELGNTLQWYIDHIGQHDYTTAEAVDRYQRGVRVTNLDHFERKRVDGIGWLVTRSGENTQAEGMSIRLSGDYPE